MQKTIHDAIIFDIDGTLWNAADASAQGWTNGIRSLGGIREISTQEIESVSGLAFPDCIRTLLPGIAESDWITVVTTLNKEEKKAIEVLGGRFYSHVIEGLKALSQHYPLFLVSNCQEWYMNTFLSHLEEFTGSPKFTDWECYGRTSLTKEENLRLLAQRNGLKNPAYVGDTVLDCMAAKNAGFEFYFVTYGFGAVLTKQKFEDFNELTLNFLRKQA